MSARTLRRDLAVIAQHLGPDELAVLVTLASRAWAGQARYGCLALRQDRRDFRREAVEELVDALFYLTAEVRRGSTVATAAGPGRRGEQTEAGSRGRRKGRGGRP